MKVMETETLSAELVTKIALALSDPLRVRILDLLVVGRADPTWSPDIPELPTAICAIDVQRRLGEDALSKSKLSYHMHELREAGLVREHRQGKWTYYILNDDVLAAFVAQVQARYLSADK